ncbi:MAG TPA: RNA polymerase sigma factor [candidate division Zixibacteria bacterium]|nr:RNA polymerase sigma factor [candidate division Zixibacteria bacterium]
MDREEQALVSLAKAGDRRAFDKLVARYKDRMFALTYRMTGDREEALDLLQETFLSAFKAMRGFREEASFSSWMYRIAANKSINYIKRRKLMSYIPPGSWPKDEPSYEMEDAAGRNELKIQIQKSVKELPPKQRLVFNLRFYEQLSFVEIAKILDKSESTVKTNYQKAVEKLQKKLEGFR